MKAGGEYNYLTLPGDANAFPGHFGGRYVFALIPSLGVTSALDGLQKGIPAVYAQGYGNPNLPDGWYSDLSFFAQDEWRRGRLVIKPGLRYQRQFWRPLTSTVSDVGGGTFTYSLPSDGNNIAPRFAVSHDATGNGRTIVHGSYGMFYDNIIMLVDGVSRVVTGAADGVRTLVLPAPLASIAWNAPGRRLSENQGQTLLGGSYVSTVFAPDPSRETPYTHQLSAGVDRALGSNLALSANVIYVRGFKLPGTLKYNPTLPTRLGAGRKPNDRPCFTNTQAPCVNGGIPGSSASVLQYTGFGELRTRG